MAIGGVIDDEEASQKAAVSWRKLSGRNRNILKAKASIWLQKISRRREAEKSVRPPAVSKAKSHQQHLS